MGSIARARARDAEAGLPNVTYMQSDVSQMASDKPFDAAVAPMNKCARTELQARQKGLATAGVIRESALYRQVDYFRVRCYPGTMPKGAGTGPLVPRSGIFPVGPRLSIGKKIANWHCNLTVCTYFSGAPSLPRHRSLRH